MSAEKTHEPKTSARSTQSTQRQDFGYLSISLISCTDLLTSVHNSLHSPLELDR